MTVVKSSKKKNHRINWINSVLSNGVTPKIEQIDQCPWIESVDLEKKYIKYYRDLGYDLVNETDGGEGTLGYKRSKETINKLKQSLRKLSYKIYQYDMDGNFIKCWNNIPEASESLNIRGAGINKCIRHTRQTYKNYRWMDHLDLDPASVLNKTNFNKIKKNILNKNARRVIQLDFNNVELNRYNSPWKACQALKVNVNNSSNITQVCLGKKRTALGFKWKYE